MATYTMTLHQVMELTADIGLNDYPLFDPDYREPLNEKIKGHFLNREIAHETISMFRHQMRQKMSEIMPYYNQFYESERLKFDPLATVDIRNLSTTTGTAESSEDSEAASSSVSKSRAVASDFPQTRLAGNKDYATSAQDNEAATDSTSTGKGASKTSQDGTTDTTTTGFQGNRSALLQEYRATFLNIDMMVIDDLQELFMGIWSNGDSYVNEWRPGYGYGLYYRW